MKWLSAASTYELPASKQSPSQKEKRFKRWNHACCAAVLFIFLAVPAAFGQVNFSQVVSFGDSLTNNDILGLYYGNPHDMYGADAMEATFKKGAKSGNRLTTYAVASMESDYLEAEIGIYMVALIFGQQKKATLFCIEIGGNDILNNLNIIKAYPPGKNKSADKVVNNIIQNIRNGFNLLKRSHPKAQFVLWTVPDVTLTPTEWQKNTSTETANIQAHLKRLNLAIQKLGDSSVVVLDLYTLIQNFVSSPPVIYGQQLLLPPVHSEYDSIFADEIHPTAVSNALIANTIINQMNTKWHVAIASYTEAQLAKLAHIQQ